jgi:hypothetical protein
MVDVVAFVDGWSIILSKEWQKEGQKVSERGTLQWCL